MYDFIHFVCLVAIQHLNVDSTEEGATDIEHDTQVKMKRRGDDTKFVAKMLLYGGTFGCLSPILSISAFIKSPFVYPKDEKQNVERAKFVLLATEKTDGSNDPSNGNRQYNHFVMMFVYQKWKNILRELESHL